MSKPWSDVSKLELEVEALRAQLSEARHATLRMEHSAQDAHAQLAEAEAVIKKYALSLSSIWAKSAREYLAKWGSKT